MTILYALLVLLVTMLVNYNSTQPYYIIIHLRSLKKKKKKKRRDLQLLDILLPPEINSILFTRQVTILKQSGILRHVQAVMLVCDVTIVNTVVTLVYPCDVKGMEHVPNSFMSFDKYLILEVINILI